MRFTLRFSFCKCLWIVWSTFLLSKVAADSLYSNDDTNVHVLSSLSDADTLIKQSTSVWMIQFYHPESDACKEFAPSYKALAKVVNGMYPIAVVDVSSEEGKAIAKAFKLSDARVSKSTPWICTVAPSPYDNTNSKLVHFNKDLTIAALGEALFYQQSNVIQERGAALGLTKEPKPEKPRRTAKNQSEVVELNADNFDGNVLQNPGIVAVAFTAPWCGHCTKLRPEWEEAAKKLAGEGVVLGWLDATANQELASVFGVRGYPTIKVFPGGSPKTPDMAKDYQGEREAAGIVQFMLLEVDRSGVPKTIPQLTSPAILQESCGGKNHICVLAALPHILDSGAAGRNKYRDMLASVSKSFRGSSYSFLWFEAGGQPELEQSLELTFGAPAVVAYSMDRQAYAVMHSAFSEKSITAFLHGITTGRQRTVQLSPPLPTVIATEPWDGQDGAPIEDEIDLSEIMGDEF
jgi:protein disulfide-isomerase A6